MATLDEIVSGVLHHLDRSNVGATESSLVKTWINQAIVEDLCADISWASMEFTIDTNTVEGQDVYDIPALYANSIGSTNLDLVKDVQMVRFSLGTGNNYIVLPEVDERVEYDRMSDIAKGSPQMFARTGESIRLRPIPDSTGDAAEGTYKLRIHGWAYPSPLVAGTDHNEITDRHPQLVEYCVICRGLMYYGDYEKASYFQQKYEQKYQSAINNEKRRKSPANLVMRPSVAAGRPASPVSGWKSMRGPAYGGGH